MRNRVLDQRATTLCTAFFVASSVALLGSCSAVSTAKPNVPTKKAATPNVARRAAPNTRALKIVAAARAQVGDLYDQNYYSLAFPNGDVPKGRGACTDVIIRSLRAVGYDLQKLIYDDKKRHRALYPRGAQHSRLDPNIDHRRVPNQKIFFTRFGQTLTNSVTSSTRNQWKAGDIVQWKFDNGLDHIGIISDKTNARGWPLAIHNVGGCQENDVLTAWKIVGHFRFPK